MSLVQWAAKHGVSYQALAELRAMMGIDPSLLPTPKLDANAKSEAYVQSLVRLEAPHKGVTLWRNNVGVLKDRTGRPVRYGLANDNPALNDEVKSADLIGWRRVHIGAHHVGLYIAQFVSRECKEPGWTYSGTNHERAQLKWADFVIRDGGDAKFCTGEGTL